MGKGSIATFARDLHARSILAFSASRLELLTEAWEREVSLFVPFVDLQFVRDAFPT